MSFRLWSPCVMSRQPAAVSSSVPPSAAAPPELTLFASHALHRDPWQPTDRRHTNISFAQHASANIDLHCTHPTPEWLAHCSLLLPIISMHACMHAQLRKNPKCLAVAELSSSLQAAAVMRQGPGVHQVRIVYSSCTM